MVDPTCHASMTSCNGGVRGFTYGWELRQPFICSYCLLKGYLLTSIVSLITGPYAALIAFSDYRNKQPLAYRPVRPPWFAHQICLHFSCTPC